MDKDVALELYRQVTRIRALELLLNRHISEHGFGGFWHPGLGQEGVQAGAVSALRDDDYLFYAHRGLGYALAKGMSPVTLLADLFGRTGGSVGGKGGGTVHFVDPERGVLGQGGTVGSSFVLGAGAGISAQMLGTDRVVAIFFGDGAAARGTFHEAALTASVWKLPLVWVVGKPKKFGFLLECAPCALIKRGTVADWSQFSEIFGMPLRIAKYDTNDLKTKIELKTALDESGSAMVLMIPKQADFDIKDGKVTNADGSIYSNLKDAMNDEMSVIVLGATETTTSSKKSGYAQSQTHADQQLEKTKKDLTDLQTKLNSQKFISILQSYDLPLVPGGKFRYEEEVNLDQLGKRIIIDMAVAKRVPVSDDYFYETYGIDKPDNYDELKKKMESQAVPPGAGGAPDPEADPADEPEADPDTPPENLTPWERLRLQLANFFDRARND